MNDWKLPEHNWSRWLLACAVLVLASGMSCVTGCSLLAPGEDTRRALESKQTTDYDESGNFSTEESTTHERNNVVLEGENVTAEFDPTTGKLLRLTGATNVMVQISRPQDAAAAKTALDAMNLQIGLKALEGLDRMLSILAARDKEVRVETTVEPKKEK